MATPDTVAYADWTALSSIQPAGRREDQHMYPVSSSIVQSGGKIIAARSAITCSVRLLALVTCLSATIASSAAFAGSVFKWTDENGVIHYSDQKPASGASKMNVTTTGTPSKDASERDQSGSPVKKASNNESGFDLNPELQSQIKKLEKQQQVDEVQAKIDAATAAELNSKQERCASLHKNKKTMQENARVQVNTDDGSKRYLSAEEVVERRNEIEAELAKDCG